MTRLITSTVGFVISYLVLMIPTYMLPYAGSNSAIINGMGALLGRGPTPQWWMHFWCLFMLILVGHVRGRLMGKPYLLVFPIVALVFDLTPGLSAIPLVPTVLHLLCLILGAMGSAPAATGFAETPSFGRTGLTAAGISALSVVGMLWFTVNTQSTAAAIRETRATEPAPVATKGRDKAVVPQETRAVPKSTQPSPETLPTPTAKPLETAVAAPPTAKVHKPTAPKPPVPVAKAEKPTVRMINIRD